MPTESVPAKLSLLPGIFRLHCGGVAAKTRRRKPSIFPKQPMRLRHFVSLSSCMLCGWLVVTFVTEVPVKRYPKLDKHVMDVGRQAQALEHPLAAARQSEAGQFSVSQ